MRQEPPLHEHEPHRPDHRGHERKRHEQPRDQQDRQSPRREPAGLEPARREPSHRGPSRREPPRGEACGNKDHVKTYHRQVQPPLRELEPPRPQLEPLRRDKAREKRHQRAHRSGARSRDDHDEELHLGDHHIPDDVDYGLSRRDLPNRDQHDNVSRRHEWPAPRSEHREDPNNNFARNKLRYDDYEMHHRDRDKDDRDSRRDRARETRREKERSAAVGRPSRRASPTGHTATRRPTRSSDDGREGNRDGTAGTGRITWRTRL